MDLLIAMSSMVIDSHTIVLAILAPVLIWLLITFVCADTNPHTNKAADDCRLHTIYVHRIRIMQQDSHPVLRPPKVSERTCAAILGSRRPWPASQLTWWPPGT